MPEWADRDVHDALGRWQPQHPGYRTASRPRTAERIDAELAGRVRLAVSQGANTESIAEQFGLSDCVAEAIAVAFLARTNAEDAAIERCLPKHRWDDVAAERWERAMAGARARAHGRNRLRRPTSREWLALRGRVAELRREGLGAQDISECMAVGLKWVQKVIRRFDKTRIL